MRSTHSAPAQVFYDDLKGRLSTRELRTLDALVLTERSDAVAEERAAMLKEIDIFLSPLPCRDCCTLDGIGAYCRMFPCYCDCHHTANNLEQMAAWLRALDRV